MITSYIYSKSVFGLVSFIVIIMAFASAATAISVEAGSGFPNSILENQMFGQTSIFHKSDSNEDKIVSSKLRRNLQTGDFIRLRKTQTAAPLVESNIEASFNANAAEESGYVKNTVVQLDGKIIVGGYFSDVNNLPRPYLVRLNPDGSVDMTFNLGGTGPSGAVLALALQPDGKIIIGNNGKFYNGKFTGLITRLNSDGTPDAAFNGGFAGESIESIAVQTDGKIIIGGVFTTSINTPSNGIARLNSDGTFDTSFNTGSGFNDTVSSIVLQPDGKILIGGFFSLYRGNTTNRIIRLNADGNRDTTFNAGAVGAVKTVVLQPDGKIIIGGSFTTFNGIAVSLGLVRLNSGGSIETAFNLPGLTAAITAIALLPNGGILAAGTFNNGTETSRGIASFNLPLGTSFGSSQANGDILSLVVLPDGKLLAGGRFTQYNGEEHYHLVRLNANGSVDNTFSVKISTASFAESTKLTAANGTLSSQFGSSTAIDGDTLIIGAPNERNESNTIYGAAYIFVRDGTGWTQQAKLTATEATVGLFGNSVAISGDTVIVGDSGDNSAYIFLRNGSSWTLQQKLIASDVTGTGSVNSVAIDGDTVAIGAFNDGVQNVRPGAAYIFNRVGANWFQQAKLIDSMGRNSAQFGFSIDVNGDTVIVGSRFGDVGAKHGIGVACVYTRNGNIWTQQERLAANDASDGDQFGFSVALEGNTTVVGAIGNTNGTNIHRGSAYVFVRNEAGWTQQQKIFSETALRFGGSVDISGDTIIIGASNEDILGNPSSGSAYVFVKQGANWEQLTKLLASDAKGSDFFGNWVAVSGNKFIIGAPGVDIGSNNNQGAAYYFIKPTFAPDLQPTSDTGTSNTDNITNSHNLFLSISGVANGATIELVRNGAVIDSVVAGGTTITFNDANIPSEGIFGYSTRQTINGEISSRSEITYVVIDNTSPSVTINQAEGQTDPTSGQSVNFTAVFNEPVAGFDISDVSFAGSTAVISGPNSLSMQSAATYLVSANNIISDGQNVRAGIAAGAAQDLAGNSNLASTSVDNTITVDNVRPTVTINQAVGQIDPTRILPLNFTVVFSEPVIGFFNTDVSLSGSTANVSSAFISVTGSGTTYNVAVSNFTSNGGVVRASVLPQAAFDALNNQSVASTSTDNTVTVDNVSPTVTINQAAGQTDPTSALPVNFTVVFSEAVTGFDASDISLSGLSINTAGASIAINGSGTTYNVAVGSIISNGGFIRASVRSGAASDLPGNLSIASTSTDNTVTINTKNTSSDFDRDGRADISVYRPSSGTWYVLNSQSGFSAVQFGLSTDKIVPADYDGDGKTDIAVYRGGTWYLQRSQLGFTSVQFGLADDIPVPADFDAAGKADLAVYRPSNGTWYVLNGTTNQYGSQQWGLSTDKPVVSDYDGDGKADYAVYRPSNGTWYLLRSRDGFASVQWGVSTDKPVVEDYDGDGKADPAVYRPSNGTWYLLRSRDGFSSAQFGEPTDLPVLSDYDGDGKTDVAVYRPSNGTWYLLKSTDGFAAIQFGDPTDRPIPNAFVP